MVFCRTQVSPEEKVRNFKQSLGKFIREIERARTRLQTGERNMKNDIKRLTNRGEMDSVMIVCKDLVRSRAAAQKFMRFSSQLQALGLRIMTISAQAGAATALKGVTQAMHRLNQMMNVPEIQAIVQKFMMEDEMLDMKDDIANEAFDTLFDAEGTVDEDAATQYAQIFAEMRLPVPLQIAALAEVGAEPLLLP